MTRNSKLLASFVKYCESNPELRFWQALRNWSGFPFVYVSNTTDIEIPPEINTFIKDTFYFEEKNK